MANHQSAIKRIRSSKSKKTRNKYQHKTTRNAIRELRLLTSKSDASKKYNEIASMLDKLAKKNVIHKNKASNLKSELAKHINTLK